MSDNIKNAIRAIIAGEAKDGTDLINAELAAKSLDAIAVKKIEVSSNFFNQDEEDDQEDSEEDTE